MPQIYGYALSGVGRCGAERSGYTSPSVFVAIAGVQYATARLTDANKVVDGTLSITEVLNETPNTAALTMMGAEPPEGADVVVTLGSINNLDRLYAGTVINRTHAYVGTPAAWNAPLNVIDYTWQLTRRRVSGLFTNVSPAVVAAAIVAAVPGFTLKVAAGLPTIDTFSFTDVDALAALTQLAQRIGGYCDVDYHKVVKLFITDASVTNPVDLTSAHVSLSEFSYTRDLSQVRTRVFVEGGGVNALAACAPGETIIPVATAAWYNPLGSQVKSGPQHIAYAGLQVGAGGSLVGPGTSPAAAPSLALAAGAGLGTGAYQYAYTDVTPSGESLPSPLGLIATTSGPVAPPALAANYGGTTLPGGGQTAGYYQYSYTFVTVTGETTVSPAVQIHTGAGLGLRVANIAVGPAGVTSRNVYRTPVDTSGGGIYPLPGTPKFLGTIANNTTTTYDDIAADASLGAAPPVTNTATASASQVALSSIAIGASPTTSRKVYRTAVGGAQLKLLTTLADNTTTTFLDTIADGSLGANVPTSDTSALAQPTGQVLAGAISLLAAGAGAFSPTGGWAIVGSQVIRYTGITGNTLTGIPTSGPGAITATITYNTGVTAAPALIGIPASGVGAIRYLILVGDPVNVLVQVDDTAAQGALATLMGGTDDGVVEDYIQDGSIGETEAIARGRARLAQASQVLVSVTFKTRDRNTHAGRTIHVNLGSPTSVTADFQIQQVTIDTFGPALLPTYTVQASSARFSLEDLLRVFRQQAN